MRADQPVARPPVPVPTGISRHQVTKTDETNAASAPETLTTDKACNALFTVAPVPSEHQVPPGTHHPQPVSDRLQGVDQHNHHQKTKVHWHTIEFSHNITTPRHQPHVRGQSVGGIFFVRACFPLACSHLCGALSVALTHIKLHTPPHRHNSPGQRP